MNRITTSLEYTFRIFTGLVCIHQYFTVHSRLGNYCVNQFGALSVEGRWLDALVILQVAKIFLFSFWEVQSGCFLEQRDDSYDEISQDNSDMEDSIPKPINSF